MKLGNPSRSLKGSRMRNKIMAILMLIKKSYKLFEIIFFFMCSLFFRIRKKNRGVWLLCERGYDARDNSFYFYKYLRQNHPSIKAYYLITEENKLDFERVKLYGNVLKYRGFRHKLLFFTANFLITSHSGAIEPWNFKFYKKLFGIFNKKQKYVFLQHGVIMNDVVELLGKHNTSFNLFITGAKPEYEYIRSDFGYENDEIVYTGLARFDTLIRSSRNNQILIMPTWRSFLSEEKNKEKRKNIFLNSEFYRAFQSLINNPELDRLLCLHGLEIYFYLHNEMQEFSKYFNSKSNNVVVANKEHYDIQKLLVESALLITDYSSVSVDFAFMGKPVLYYQFDKKSFFSSHYKKGYFSYELHGFGPVLLNEKEVVSYIEKCINLKFETEVHYVQRINNFFVIRDQHNCERIYQAITKLL